MLLQLFSGFYKQRVKKVYTRFQIVYLVAPILTSEIILNMFDE